MKQEKQHPTPNDGYMKLDSKDSNEEKKLQQKLRSLQPTQTKDSRMLTLSFIAMVFIGLGNKIFQKLQTIPMYNYPNFLNLLTTFVYVPLSFAYILPMIRYGSAITPEQQAVPKHKFAIMGILDSFAGIMQVFSATYISGSLLILLGQAAIPVSMIISRLLLKTKYNNYQYVGAIVVTVGLLIVLGPSIGSSDDLQYTSSGTLMWSTIMILSCLPMCLSSVYKEKALGETELDAVYLNGWIAVFQFLISIPLAVPAALVGDPPVQPADLLQNLINGFKCYMGHNSIIDGAHPDQCEKAPLFVSIYLIFNLAYNILIILILKFGTATILFLAMTIMVPLGNVAFTFPFMPGHEPLQTTDIWGLIIIMIGLFTYRFLHDIVSNIKKSRQQSFQASTKESLLHFVHDEEVEV